MKNHSEQKQVNHDMEAEEQEFNPNHTPKKQCSSRSSILFCSNWSIPTPIKSHPPVIKKADALNHQFDSVKENMNKKTSYKNIRKVSSEEQNDEQQYNSKRKFPSFQAYLQNNEEEGSADRDYGSLIKKRSQIEVQNNAKVSQHVLNQISHNLGNIKIESKQNSEPEQRQIESLQNMEVEGSPREESERDEDQRGYEGDDERTQSLQQVSQQFLDRYDDQAPLQQQFNQFEQSSFYSINSEELQQYFENHGDRFDDQALVEQERQQIFEDEEYF